MALKILIAEDEEITLKHLVNALQLEGHEVTGVSRGDDALRLVEDRRFDVLIADIKMPGMTGIELLGTIRERNIETDVIVVTGFGSVGSAVEAMKLGAYDYVTKPFDLDELVLKVAKINERANLKRENVALRTFLG
ncbi:MAG TPA: Fis family transcriptional regulator, partial [Nitrospiraceae bacterium]|nr:Fis family transcriptional regulator [Nitrospiraceae bacterium]